MGDRQPTTGGYKQTGAVSHARASRNNTAAHRPRKPDHELSPQVRGLGGASRRLHGVELSIALFGLDIAQRLPATLELTLAALSLAILVGIPLGVIAGVNHNRWPDFALRLFTITGVAVATFWFAIMLQLLFSMQLDWLPLRGRSASGMALPPVITGSLILDSLIAGRLDACWDALRHLVLPAVTLSLGALATIARFTRAGVLETMQRDFVLYERAVGYPRRRLIWVYVLRNSVIAAVTQIGLLFGTLIAGAVVVESIFDWPGIGNYAVQAILTADYKVMLAVTLLIGVVYTVVNIVIDLVHGLLDPRLWEQL
jgi:peptide/nickel transport system permease protein